LAGRDLSDEERAAVDDYFSGKTDRIRLNREALNRAQGYINAKQRVQEAET
jgi:hypothetical protein